MLPPEILNRLPSVIFWIVLIVTIAVFMLSRLAEGRSKAAELLGPMGRWFRHRADERKKRWQLEIREAVDTPDYKVMQRRVTWLEKMVVKLEAEAERDAIRIKKLELVEEVHGAHQDMTSEYLREDAQWHIDASMMAAEKDFQLPWRRSYTQFVREYREKQGLEYGRRWTDNPESQEWKEE